jgi:hypothetical protein
LQDIPISAGFIPGRRERDQINMAAEKQDESWRALSSLAGAKKQSPGPFSAHNVALSTGEHKLNLTLPNHILNP